MIKVLEISDKNKKRIYLYQKTWSHICNKHPEIPAYLFEFENILKNPTQIITYQNNEKIKYYYKYFKERKTSNKYLLILVKYLNGEGIIITAYFVGKVK